MIALFEKELVLEILLVVGQEMELRENAQYNLLMMEILHHIVKTQDPTAVARSVRPTPSKATAKHSSDGVGAKLSKPSSSSSFSSSSGLASKLKHERSQLNNMKSVRHGHFSGTWMRKQSEGRRQFIGASNAVQGGSLQNRGLVQARRKNRLSEPFIGSSKSFLAHTRSQLQLTGSAGGPSAKRANQTLHEFCKRFLADCYGPFMKSIKNEFRRDSQRLEEKDKIVFFKLVWFFSQWSRISSSSSSSSRRTGKNNNEEAVGRLIITMDVFTFNLVLSATDSFYQQKKYTRLAQTVALYAEMIHLLHSMYTSKDNTEHEMAMGLIDRLFYHGQDALDQLPRLISRWTPGTYTREYLCDLIEVAHVSLKLLEANTKRGIEFVLNKDGANNNLDNGKFSKKIAKMRKDAAEFDVKGYFVRKIVSNQFISMYSYLLDQYKINAAIVNHRIIFMFLRVMRMEIATPDIADAEESVSPLEIRRVTLEPMLYNLQLLIVIERILNDDSIQKDKSFESLIKFSTSLLYKFWCSADSNPMLYVECLFQHATPHRFCESVTNMYVNDELRMIAEREMLQEDQDRKRMEFGDDNEEIPSTARDDDDDEAELEFTEDTFSKPSHSNESNRNDESEATEETGNARMEKSEAQDDSVHPERERSPPLSRKRSTESGDDSSDDELFASETQSQAPTKRRKNTIESDDSDDDANIKGDLVG
jgi:timeless